MVYYKVQKRYIRGNDLVYADKGEDTERQYYVTDTHGNVVQLTDESGAVIKTYEYDSFGNEGNPDRKDDNPFRYCGEYYDKETEEIYLRARYYQPKVGRFLTRDSYTGEEDEPLSLHLYTYCENDGVNSIDPSGHKIKLTGSKKKKNKILKNLKKLTTVKIKLKSKGRIKIEKKKDKKYPDGYKLIKELCDSKYTVKIKVDNSILTSETETKESEASILFWKLTIKSAEIRLNTKNKPRVLVAPYKYQPSHEEVIPKYISLGHELIHALTFFKGLSSGSQTVTYYYADEHGNRVADSGLKEELETVGIFGSQLGITENSTRREHGLDIRVRYRGRQ